VLGGGALLEVPEGAAKHAVLRGVAFQALLGAALHFRGYRTGNSKWLGQEPQRAGSSVIAEIGSLLAGALAFSPIPSWIKLWV
jgi:hypothetical protein